MNTPARVPVWRLGLWIGLLTGLGEVSLLGAKKLILHQFVLFGPNVVWMSPLANAVLFSMAGLVLFILGRRGRADWTRVTTWTLAFLGFLSLLLMYYPLHLYAKLLLAAGLAVQVARIQRRWPAGFARLVQRSTPWLAALVATLAVGIVSWRAIAFERSVAALPAARAGAPNVLLIVLDTVRAQNLSLYGYDRSTTPNLERWAKTAVVFDRATAAAPWTLPSHASMFTGRWPHELSADWDTPLDSHYPTLAEVLSRHGYVTGGFVGNTNYCGYETGLARGFALYEDYVASVREVIISSSLARSVLNSQIIRRITGYYDNIPRKSAAQVNDHFLEWASTPRQRPFFAFLNYFDAHEAYLPPPPFREKFGPDLPRGNEHLSQDLRRSLRDDWRKRPATDIQTELDMYDGAIAYIDEQLNTLFQQMQVRGLLNNTLVILTADHGEQFGEHGFFLHSSTLYEPLLRVPLLISFPNRVPAGQRVTTRVSLRDLPATILDLTGITDFHEFPGSSLADAWSGDDRPAARVPAAVFSEVRHAPWARDWFPWYPSAKGDMQSLADDRFHYIRNGDGREELYVPDQDPGEEHDLSGKPESREVLARFRSELERLSREAR